MKKCFRTVEMYYYKCVRFYVNMGKDWFSEITRTSFKLDAQYIDYQNMDRIVFIDSLIFQLNIILCLRG